MHNIILLNNLYIYIILIYYIKSSRPGRRGKVVEGQLTIQDAQPSFWHHIDRLRGVCRTVRISPRLISMEALD